MPWHFPFFQELHFSSGKAFDTWEERCQLKFMERGQMSRRALNVMQSQMWAFLKESRRSLPLSLFNLATLQFFNQFWQIQSGESSSEKKIEGWLLSILSSSFCRPHYINRNMSPERDEWQQNVTRQQIKRENLETTRKCKELKFCFCFKHRILWSIDETCQVYFLLSSCLLW